MSQQKFVNRIEEMKILEDVRSAKGASLFILYGRRRVGKTELVSKFVGDRWITFYSTTTGHVKNSQRQFFIFDTITSLIKSKLSSGLTFNPNPPDISSETNPCIALRMYLVA